MIKILHAADFHLDSLFHSLPPEQAAQCRAAQREQLFGLAEICRQEAVQLVLLPGDLFDKPHASRESIDALVKALEEMAVPVFITPGNHDYLTPDSPYRTVSFPSNVHIFTKPELGSVSLPQLSCRIYGAGYTSMDCPPLLSDFQKTGDEQYHIMLLHGEITGAEGDYCPITRGQAAASGLDYLALGHNHQGGQLSAGATLCAWPGCPMGRGFDETGEKGVLLVTLSKEERRADFLSLRSRQYRILSIPAGDDPLANVLAALPPDAKEDIYRIIFTGEADEIDLPKLEAQLSSEFFALNLRDKTTPKLDLWQVAEEDSLEGRLLALLRQTAAETDDETLKRRLILAARISRKLMDGREVELP